MCFMVYAICIVVGNKIIPGILGCFHFRYVGTKLDSPAIIL